MKRSVTRKFAAVALSLAIASGVCAIAPVVFADEPATDPVASVPTEKISVDKATVTLSSKTMVYTGNTQAPNVTSVVVKGTQLTENVDYKVTTQKRKKVGTGKVTITGIGNYTGTTFAQYKIVKAKTKLRIAAKNKKIKAKTLSKKSVNVSKIVVKGNHGGVYFKKLDGDDCLTVSKTSGKIKIAKGTAPGTYTITVHIAAKSTANYKSATEDKKITIVVK